MKIMFDTLFQNLKDGRRPTLGGVQFWTDVKARAGWRVQVHAFSDTYRLVDPAGWQVTSGAFRDCETRLMEETAHWRPTEDKLMITIHGLFSSHHCMKPLREHVAEEGFETATVTYASLREGVQSVATTLSALIEDMAEDRPVSLVTHSMGGLIAREVSNMTDIKDIVMIATPNNGAEMAEGFSIIGALYENLIGPSGQDLRPTRSSQFRLPSAKTRVRAIAGIKGDGKGWNPLLSGDNDGVVTREEVALEGYEPPVEISALHHLIINEPEVLAATRDFLTQPGT